MFEFGIIVCPGIMPRVRVCAVMAAAKVAVLVFVSVNQVLVRLWARATKADP
jgi:hypothetical protein